MNKTAGSARSRENAECGSRRAWCQVVAAIENTTTATAAWLRNLFDRLFPAERLG